MSTTADLNLRWDVPVLFLDIDGVVNSYPSPKANHIRKYGPFEMAVYIDPEPPHKDYMLWYSPKVIDFLNSLHRRGLVDIVWLTTWKDKAVSDFAPLVGLDTFPTITDDSGGEHAHTLDWWKWRRVRDFLGDNDRNRRVIWIDDDLYKHTKDAFRYRYDDEGVNSLLITPMGAPGLIPDDMDRIRNFIGDK